MTNPNPNELGVGQLQEKEIIHVLESFHPEPSHNFYQRIEKAPWSKRYRITRLSLQVAMVVAAIFIVMLVNPTDTNPFFSTNTPTSTSTLNSDVAPNLSTTESTIGFIPTTTPSK